MRSSDRVSAVFDDMDDARDAINWLEENGVPRAAITVVARQQDTAAVGDEASRDEDEAADDAREMGSGALAGAGVGAGVGALFGLAAAAIPGVGPFIAAGALANALGVTAGAAVSGAIVGGTSGGIAGALAHWGLNESESRHYAGEVERGGIFVGVDTTQATLGVDTIEDAFRRYHGRMVD